MGGFEKLKAAVAANAFRIFTRSNVTAPQWSETVRRMHDGAHFRFANAPYQREMMETPFDPKVQMTVYQMASRLGKTETFLNIIGHSIDEAPRNIGVLYPTNGSAEKFSKQTLEQELFAPTPRLSWLVRRGRREGTNTIQFKIFPGGLIQLFGGHGSSAAGDLRRAKLNLLIADEVDALEERTGDEGDQLEIFWMRGSEYADAIKIAASYPSRKGDSRIEDLMATSDFRRWETPCPHCGAWIVLMRDQIRHPERRPDRAYLEPPCCAEKITDAQRRRMVKKGRWKATRKFRGVAGFWANAMISPHPTQRGFRNHLHFIAATQLKAEAAENPERARRVIVNTIDAESFQPETIEAPDRHRLLKQREEFDAAEAVPDGVLMITAGADIQKTWKEISVWGWGLNREKWLLDHQKFNGGPEDPRTFEALLKWLTSRKYRRADGSEIAFPGKASRPAVFVDSSHWGDEVMRWTKAVRNLGIYACQGQPGVNAPVIAEKRQHTKNGAYYYPIGVNQAKETVYGWLALPAPDRDQEPPPGYCHFPTWTYEDYFRGLTAEEGKEERFRGEIFTRYVCPKGRRNEPLDCFVYAYAAKEANPRNALERLAKARNSKKAAGPPQKRQKRVPWALR